VLVASAVLAAVALISADASARPHRRQLWPCGQAWPNTITLN